MTKKCKKCGVEQALDRFIKNADCKDGRGGTCKKCSREYQKAWDIARGGYKQTYHQRYYLANKEAFRLKSRRQHLERKYGITVEEYDALFQAQDGKCATCGVSKSKSGKMLDVDHEHATGKVRGLLCNGCNTSIGRMYENAETFRRVADYLDKHAASSTEAAPHEPWKGK